MYRYERKFKVSPRDYDFVKNQIELEGWFKQHPDRMVNNIYLDNLSKSFYYDAIEGELNKKSIELDGMGKHSQK